MTPLLEISGLSKDFSVGGRETLRAVDDVSLSVEAGETLGLVGESGCGKSTLARLIVRLHEATEGSIRFNGMDVTKAGSRDLRAYRRDVSMVFQDPYASLNPRRTVADIIAEPLRINRVGRKETSGRADELLSLVGLSREHGQRYPHEFSGGQRQRIGIARALATGPKLVVCDEPVSALDVSIQAQVLNLLRDLQQELGLTLVFIAHDLGVVRHVSDRVAVMYLGRVVETAAVETLFARPQHPYTEALLSAIPIPDPTADRAGRIMLEGDVPSPVNPPSGCAFHPRCSYASERCSAERPVLEQLGDDRAACHFPLGAGPAGAPGATASGATSR